MGTYDTRCTYLRELIIDSIIGQYLTMFGTAVVYESTFLSVKFTKSKYQSRISVEKLVSESRAINDCKDTAQKFKISQ